VLPHDIYLTDCFNKRVSRVKRCCVVQFGCAGAVVRVTVSHTLCVSTVQKAVTVYKHTQTRLLREPILSLSCAEFRMKRWKVSVHTVVCLSLHQIYCLFFFGFLFHERGNFLLLSLYSFSYIVPPSPRLNMSEYKNTFIKKNINSPLSFFTFGLFRNLSDELGQ
jgi:hypothetical protein